MNRLLIIISLFLLLACNKGTWVTQHTYRPKRPKFSIVKEPFKKNELLSNSSLYVSTKRFVNYDGNVAIGYMGFYADGRMIIGDTWEKEMDQTLKERNSFQTAVSIGHYTTDGNTIKMELFFPGDGGHYETREGIISKDMIIIVNKVPILFKKETRYDTLIKSSFPLGIN